MLHCQNCGQVNQSQTNFCRFCGTKLVAPNQHRPQPQAQPRPTPPANYAPPPQNYEKQPPRPYSWKTDEFHIDNSEEKTAIAQPRPLLQQPAAAPLATFTGHGAVADYHCPRCNTTLLPRIERRISTAGWIVFAALLVFFFPLFWIGFLMKEDSRVCPVCRFRMS